MSIRSKGSGALGPMLCAVGLGLACDPSSGTTPETPALRTSAEPAAVTVESALSEEVSDARLAIRLEIAPNIEQDRVPMRVAKLHVRNVSATEPVVLFMPRPEFIRFGTSWLALRAGKAAHFSAPTPRPHGYSVTEADFHRLEPLASKTFEQRFTLDPMVRGAGTRTERRPGFEAGKSATVVWTYSNEGTKWPGGAQTMDGVTKPLFGGEEIPHIYTGRLVAELSWILPK